MKDSTLKVSRRTFIKAAAVASGACLLGKSGDVSAALETGESTEPAYKSTSQEKWFEDSIGRKVRIPDKISGVVPTGNYAQALLCTLCPEKMESVAEIPPVKEKEEYRVGKLSSIYELPETGSIYKPDGERDLKTREITGLDANLIVDVGFVKDDLKMNIEYLQRKAETPVVFIDASFGNLPQAYRTIGGLLGCSERAEFLASYIERIYKDIECKKHKIEHPLRILYAKNNSGMYRSEGYSVHNEIIRFLGGIPVDTEESSDDSRIDIRKLESETIDYIIFNSEECYNSIVDGVGNDYEIWSQFDAVKNDQYILSPGMLHSWFGFGFFAQIIGVIWLGVSVMPGVYDYDIVEYAKDFYKAFYGHKITSEEIKYILKIN